MVVYIKDIVMNIIFLTMSVLVCLQTYMAHCIYLDEAEIEIIKKNNVGVAHCPNSNFW